MGYSKDSYTYCQMRNLLSLDSLETRRLKSDLIFLFKLFNGYLSSSDLLYVFGLNCPKKSLRSNPLFFTPLHRTNYGFSSTVARLTREANSHEVELFGVSFRKFKLSLRDIRGWSEKFAACQ